MNKKLLSFLTVVLLIFSSTVTFSQNWKILDKSSNTSLVALDRGDFRSLQRYEIAAPDLIKLRHEDSLRVKRGFAYRMGVLTDVYYSPLNSGSWKTLENGDRIWRIKIYSAGAQGLTVFFNNFKMYGGSFVQVFDENGKALSEKYDATQNLDTKVQNIPMCQSEEIIVELYEPKGVIPSEFTIDQVAYIYRGLMKKKDAGSSDSCQNDINCPQGTNFQDEKKGIVRILLKKGSGTFYCSGSLVNNQNKDCKPYLLTAFHCAAAGDGYPAATTADYNQWKFNFNFEVATCGGTPSESIATTSNTITGCIFKASSNDGGGNTGSDYLLLQLGSASNESATITKLKSTAIGAYWNGWDATGGVTTGGAGIHHPSGDVKKISLFNGSTSSVSWGGSVANTHWQITWSDGVTEGGSSGSPLFNNNGGNSRIIGTLTGGSSYCTAPTAPDAYGKMSFHWDQNTTAGHIDLKTFLDPNNTGNKICDGSYDPCTVVNAPPVANFTASQTNIPVNTTVTFTNTSTNSPTSNTWTITPSTGWTFAGGTNATTASPQVTFTQVGTYTVKLTASNSFGSDDEIKTSYIVVTQPTAPCAATSQNCDEYIKNVTLGSINNTTSCNQYTLYTTPTTSLNRNQSYTIQVAPGIVGGGGDFYTGDIMAAWIDYNHDLNFDASEQIYQETLSGSSTGGASFTVPSTAVLGTTTLRVRINYQTIDPCGTSQYGEVEDYKITIVDNASVGEVNKITDLNVFPNPTSDKVYFHALYSDGELYRIQIVDLTGRVIVNETTSQINQFSIDMSNLNAGIYQIVVHQGDKTMNAKLEKE